MPNKIVYVKNKIMPGSYIGMNKMAALKLKVPHKGKNVFYIYNDGNKGRMGRTIRHEEIEDHLLSKGWDYRRKRKVSSHDVANALEDNTDLIVKTHGDSSKRGSIRHLRRNL